MLITHIERYSYESRSKRDKEFSRICEYFSVRCGKGRVWFDHSGKLIDLSEIGNYRGCGATYTWELRGSPNHGIVEMHRSNLRLGTNWRIQVEFREILDTGASFVFDCETVSRIAEYLKEETKDLNHFVSELRWDV